MKKLRIYLDTSVISFLFADDAQEKKKVTERFFQFWLHHYDAVVSELVLYEMHATRDAAKRRALAQVVEDNGVRVLDIPVESRAEIEKLADAYIAEKTMAARNREDALHLATCTVLGCDVLLSWNRKHLANLRTMLKANEVNRGHGHSRTICLLTPEEMMDHESKD